MRLRVLTTLAMAAFAVLAFAQSGSTPITPENKEKVLADVNKIMSDTAFVPGVDFAKWPDFLKKQKGKIDEAKTNRDLSFALNEALQEFGISHVVLNTPEGAMARMNRRVVGIGISIEFEKEKGILVTGVFPGSPAQEAGLLPGDVIFEHNGKKIESQSDLVGEEGQEAKIKLLREGKTLAFKIVRRPFSNLRPETLSWPAKDTALLRIWTFDLSYNPERVEELMKEAATAKNLIIDLRSNGGGAVTNMLHLLALLAPHQTPIGSFVSRSAVNNYVRETGGSPTEIDKIAKWNNKPLKTSRIKGVEPYKGNLAVLVNGGSGSASEITAAALQEVRSASIIGEKSAGAVLVSVIRPISGGFTLQYPITDFVTPNGVRLEGRGVLPLLDANPNPKYGEADECIEKAVLLLGRIARHEKGGG